MIERTREQLKLRPRREDDTLSREEFIYGSAGDTYVCPRGKLLRTTGKVHDEKTALYRASKFDCDPCRLKARCCPNTPFRKIPRDIHEPALDRARALATTATYVQSGRQRKKIEVLFGDVKRNLAITRLRLRGLSGARDEFLITAIVQNLKRLAKHAGRSPPAAAPCSA